MTLPKKLTEFLTMEFRKGRPEGSDFSFGLVFHFSLYL